MFRASNIIKISEHITQGQVSGRDISGMSMWHLHSEQCYIFGSVPKTGLGFGLDVFYPGLKKMHQNPKCTIGASVPEDPATRLPQLDSGLLVGPGSAMSQGVRIRL